MKAVPYRMFVRSLRRLPSPKLVTPVVTNLGDGKSHRPLCTNHDKKSRGESCAAAKLAMIKLDMFFVFIHAY